MKFRKRFLSMLLVLCMVLSMLPAIGLPASAASGETYTLYTASTISDGKYIIVGSGNSNAMTSKVTGNWIYPSSGTYTGDSIVDPDDSVVWNISGGIITTSDSTVTGNKALYASADKKLLMLQAVQLGHLPIVVAFGIFKMTPLVHCALIQQAGVPTQAPPAQRGSSSTS